MAHRSKSLDFSGFSANQRRDSIQGFDPERALLVDSCDALGQRHEGRTALLGRRLHELADSLLRGAVNPRRQRIVLRLRGWRAPHESEAEPEVFAASPCCQVANLSAPVNSFGTKTRLTNCDITRP